MPNNQIDLFENQLALGVIDDDRAITSFREDCRWLSNFYPCHVTYKGIDYPTVEHAYQAAKTDDVEIKKQIASIDRPGKTKGILPAPPDWRLRCVGIMQELIDLKFNQPGFREKLLATGSRPIIEGNSWNDTFWGQCQIGNGRNMLGILLMRKRASLQLEIDRAIHNQSPSCAP